MDDHHIPRGVATLSGPVRVNFDGACKPPSGGIATYGYHIEGGGFFNEDKGLAITPGSPHSTNNVAEYSAAIHALGWLLAQGYRGDVVLAGDSELVIRQMKGEYQVRAEHLKAYHDHLVELASRFHHVEFHWVPREENTRADALSKEALEEVRASFSRRRAVGAPRDGAPGEADERGSADP